MERLSAPASDTGREPWSAVLAVVAGALVLRLVGPLDGGLWFDEIRMLVESARAPIGTLVSTYPSDNHHPLYGLLAALSIRALGESAWALRLPAVVFGALSVGMLLVYGRRVADRREAYLAVALLATSSHHVWFSQNARGYTILLFCALAAQHAFERLLVARDRRALAAYALALGCGVYAHLSAAFLAAGHLVALGLRAMARARRGGAGNGECDRRAFLGLLLGAGFGALLYAPMAGELLAFFAAKATADAARSAAATAAGGWASPWWPLRAAAESLGLGLPAGLAALAAGALVLVRGAFDHARLAPWRLAAWLMPGVLFGAVVIGLSRQLWPRFFFFLAGFVLLVFVRGWRELTGPAWARLARHRAGWVPAAVLLIVWTALLPRAYGLPKQDFAGALAYLESTREPGETVGVVGLARFVYDSHFVTDYLPIRDLEELDRATRGTSGLLVVSTLRGQLAKTAPALDAAITARGREVARFAGSVGGGDVVIHRVAPAAEEGPR